jgi:hypothetical protein
VRGGRIPLRRQEFVFPLDRVLCTVTESPANPRAAAAGATGHHVPEITLISQAAAGPALHGVK